jgi:hypothetical protein
MRQEIVQDLRTDLQSLLSERGAPTDPGLPFP